MRANGFVCFLMFFVLGLPLFANDKLDFWSSQKKGANQFNKIPRESWFVAAKDLGLQYVRLVPDKWKGEQRDFLIGDADDFTSINEKDFATLKQSLDWADQHGIKIVFGMLSLPGCRWVQLNNEQQDYRLWNDEKYHAQAAEFWKQVASHLKGHPAIVAYNLLNEPHPELEDKIDGAGDPKFGQWLKDNRNTPADLDRFYRTIVAAIRSVDPDTPILIEGYAYGSIEGLTHLSPIKDDPAILYSLHSYEPWNYTTARVNADRFTYPSAMPKGWDGPAEVWTKANLEAIYQPAAEWAAKHSIPKNRIVAAEFGCGRTVGGAAEYLRDVVSILNANGWHWSFYSYREDNWDQMDYELGTGRPGAAYWEQVETTNDIATRKPNPLFNVLRDEFQN